MDVWQIWIIIVKKLDSLNWLIDKNCISSQKKNIVYYYISITWQDLILTKGHTCTENQDHNLGDIYIKLWTIGQPERKKRRPILAQLINHRRKNLNEQKDKPN